MNTRKFYEAHNENQKRLKVYKLLESILSDDEIFNRANEAKIKGKKKIPLIIGENKTEIRLLTEELFHPLALIKSRGLNDVFSFVDANDLIIIHDTKNNRFFCNQGKVNTDFKEFREGEVVNGRDDKPLEVWGMPITASADTILTLGMMCDDFSKVNIVEPSSPTPSEPAPAPVLQKPKFSRERVVMTLCELYKNNETNPREHADFRRRFDRQTDPLMKEPTFRPADLYTGKEAVLAALKGLPEVRKIELAKDKDSLYTLLNEQFRKAHSTVDHFEKKFGKVDEFIPEASEQVIAFLAFYSHRNTISHKDLMERVIGAFEKASALPAFNADFNTPEKLDTVKAQLRTAFEKLDIPEQESKFTFKYK
ncbi:hypothetical protein [Pseudomonas tohonis]|uniref:hypothetical protein n=1 Tax=Pseudomonas tohonis TaxID=2725477 RepID=UPI001F4118FF|nr:hypothetical protein [Pseudomonas tohonis]